MSHVTQLPLTRVKNVIKSDPDITLASQEAVILIAKVGFRLYVWCTTLPYQPDSSLTFATIQFLVCKNRAVVEVQE